MSFTLEYETQSDAEEKEKCDGKNDVQIPRQSRKRIMLGESAGEISCHSGIDKRAKLNNADDRGEENHDDAADASRFIEDAIASNENKMSYDGRDRASLGVEVK